MVGVFVAGALAACTAGAPPDAAPAAAGPQVIVPGRPGDPARVLPGEQAAQERVTVPVTEAEISFMARMIVHHQQALEMAALAPQRASDTRVAALAGRITAAQGPEIAALQAWLDRQAGHGEHGGHDTHGDHQGMPGMATPTQLTELAAAQGAAFDRLFLQLMIAHHHGALVMVQDVLLAGGDVMVARTAQDIGSTQSVEIGRMEDLLAG